MTYGFLETTLDTRSSDGVNDVLLSELHFRHKDGRLYKVPVMATTDGGSTPRLAWLVPGFEPTGLHWFQWILHDSGYRGTLMVLRGTQYVHANLSRLECDQMLEYSLSIPREVLIGEKTIKAHMGLLGRKAVFSALRAAGWRHYHKP